MIPKIDQFFLDLDFGPMKFVGYDNGQFLFTTFSKLGGKWEPARDFLELHPSKFEAKLKQGELKPSFPPS